MLKYIFLQNLPNEYFSRIGAAELSRDVTL